MIASLRLWFDGLTLREKRLVLVALTLGIVTFVWFGVIRPINNGLSDGRARHGNAVLQLAAVQSKVAAVQQIVGNRPPPMSAPLEAVVRDRAAAAGFALASVSPAANNAVQISITAARPAALFPWIADLERSGVLVDSLSTSDNADQTISATLVLKTQGL